MKVGKEASMWKDVTPDMMSEEDEENGQFTRHPPQYRSENLPKCINKLDSRLKAKCSNVHVRVERKLGSPHKNPPSKECAKWALKRCFREKGNIDNEDWDGNMDSTI